MKNTNFRCIYIIESYTNTGDLMVRRFARNRRTADKIANLCNADEVTVRKAQKAEHYYINPSDVES